MIVHDVVQGSREWWALRLGMPTVSRFSQIITPSRLEPSAARFNLIAQLLTERILQKPSDFTELDDELVSGFGADGTPWMRRGSDLEDEAGRWYSAHKGIDTERVGFVTDDAATIGGSPDRRAGEGGLEIKCRSAVYHMRMLLGYDDIAERTQIQGYLWLTGWPWWDCLAYNPDLPKRLDRHFPDRAFFAAFEDALGVFRADFERAESTLDAITEDVIENDNLTALLVASIKSKTGPPSVLDPDEIDELRRDLYAAKEARVLTATEVHAVLEDSWHGDADEVRSRWAEIRALLGVEPEPAA